MDVSSTILAIASPPGRSLRGIIRISGPAALELLQQHVSLARVVASEAGPGAAQGGAAEQGQDRAGSTRHVRSRPSQRGVYRAQLGVLQHTMPALAIISPAPRSYTGEDSIELQLPGNPALLERVIDAILVDAPRRSIDARWAHPGEFTARAFFNGRLSLTQAEGVAATIAARSDAELRAAAMLRHGALGSLALELADQLATSLALVEAGIDFTDQDDVVAIAPSELHARLQAIRARIDLHLRRAVGSEQLASIPWVVLRGRPNAGKSTLFNALLGRERAVVSAVAGTTRDILAEPLSLSTDHGPAEVMLVDLAGLDDSAGESMVDRSMQVAARSATERAELIIDCVPIDEPLDLDAEEVGAIRIRTKGDLRPGTCDAAGAVRGACDHLRVSARSGAGLDDLRRAIARRLAGRAVSLAADALALQPRHESALRGALVHLDAALELVAPQQRRRQLADSELVASSMRCALDDLGSLAGDVTPDDVLGRIFGSFCIGK